VEKNQIRHQKTKSKRWNCLNKYIANSGLAQDVTRIST
jgi:hypothetical protein